jgi:hypothetical protein
MKRTKEQVAAYSSTYYQEHKEKMLAQNKINKQKNKEHFQKKQNEWKRNNPEKVRAIKMRGLLKLNLENKHITNSTLAAWAAQVKNKTPFCEWCYSEDNLEAHHILSKKEYPQLALDINNGRTMCKYCHTMIHKQGGF